MTSRIAPFVGKGLLVVLLSTTIASLAASLIFLAASATDLFSTSLYEVASFVFPAFMFVSLPFVAFGMIVLGIPVDWVLGKLESRTALAYAFSGAVGGFMLGMILSIGDAFAPVGLLGLAGTGYGLVTAFVGWFIFRAKV